MKILHTADIHIGYSTHGKDDSTRGINSRWIDFEKCFNFMVERGIAEDIDLFLFCGDAYRDASPSPTEQRIFARAIRPLLDKKIPVVMLVGNHDFPVAFGKANSLNIFGELADGVHLIYKPERKDIETKSGKVRIVGLSWANRSSLFAKEEFAKLTSEQVRDKMLELYLAFISSEIDILREEPIDYPAILAMHAHIDGAELTEGSEKPTLPTRDIIIPLSAIARKEFSYVALGHFHCHQDLNLDANPPVVYSGSIERVSFNESNQSKGFVLVDIDQEKRATYRHIETPARPMADIKIDVRLSENPMRKLRTELEKAELKEAIVRLRVKCKSEQKKDLKYPEIREMLKDAFTIAEVSLNSDEEKTKDATLQVSIGETSESLLKKYLSTRSDLKPKEEKLLALAKTLEQEENEY